MPICRTKYHGAMEYAEGAVLHFPLGLFGFEEETRFLSIEQPALRPIVFLQSLATPDLCFLALPVSVVDPSYAVDLQPEDLKRIQLPASRQPEIGSDILCLTLLVIQENGPTTANLLAPIVVNRQNLLAIQAISGNQNYSHQVPVHSEAYACS
jgi:flagellar assembly factor FliW